MMRTVTPSADEKNMTDELFRRCHHLLLKLMGHQHGWLFNCPVDVKGLRASEYYDVVRKPMDLGTIKCRLEKGRYSSPIEFAQDVQLTFGNATSYNNPSDVPYKMAQELLKLFTLEWSKIEADFAPLLNKMKMFDNFSAGATSGSNTEKGKGKEVATAKDLGLMDKKYGSWRRIFSEEFLPMTDDDIQVEHPEFLTEPSAESDGTEVHQLKDVLAATQEKLRETEEKLQYEKSENERLRKTIERMEEESPKAWDGFWDGFVKEFNDPKNWPFLP